MDLFSSEPSLYNVNGATMFPVLEADEDGKLVNTGNVVSYLVCYVLGNHYSFGFDPMKKTIEEARAEFKVALRDCKAQTFNPDGGRLDGKDMA